ncbi:cadmium-translocating P-type ATPase [Archaeoglobus fulgidus DSM 8774]|uniref:Cadmium-translocating P-type ATPase n=1 Tax=Archaeoglobus fulgidus DSM 8774 TaxID=1344584 RepID=A0A075WAK0_ARCFL|nr:cadmium-translocating P-type ATPase [Archaeoglobus fulgidus DSM 8774]
MLRSSGFEKFSSLYHNLYLSNLIEFITAISVTPTSANTASHIVAIPIAPRLMKNPFTAKARTMFSHTTFCVLFASLIALATFDGLSSMITTSTTSMAALLIAPMEMPTSAPAITGASLMPSPTKAKLSP